MPPTPASPPPGALRDQYVANLTRQQRIFRGLAAPLFRAIGGLVFERRYLRGRYFDISLKGWGWAWRSFWLQRVLRINSHVPFPVSASIAISDPRRLHFEVEDLNNFQTFGCYFQNAHADIHIGRGTYIAPNVGMITANHDFGDLDTAASGKPIVIGEWCWIGMNAVILPGVVLGPRTVVGACSVVTRSFPSGHCVVAGAPAAVIREL